MSKSSVPYIAEGFHSVTPFVMVKDADSVVDFARKAFDAEVVSQLEYSDGGIWHAQLKIGDSMIMIGGNRGGSMPDMPQCIFLYVKDANATFQKAVNAGAQSLVEPKDEFWGDHGGLVKDKAGNTWCIYTHVENVAQDELERRAQKEEAKMNQSQSKKAA